VRTALFGIAVSLAAAGCVGVEAQPPALPGAQIVLVPTASPYVRIVAGSVSALVPHGWNAVPVDPAGFHEGFVASPGLLGPTATEPVRQGITATWVDAAKVGVPSDLYYLAATGPMLSGLQRAPGCRSSSRRVFADHVPAFIDGNDSSSGDFMAEGEGVCRAHGLPATRWSYFIAAPGFGPAGAVGIPGSGLYVVVAVTLESPRAHQLLMRLLDHVRFGATGIGDFQRAVRAPMVASA
jgi:hypothetical protein